MLRTAAAGLIAAAVLGAPAAPSETVNHEVNANIRKEGRENSQIMRTMHYLTDVYGPRLTGSPSCRNAAEWAVKQMTESSGRRGRQPFSMRRSPPFEDLGVIGAVATSSRRAGGTDSTSFKEAGLPGIRLSQDPIEYARIPGTRTSTRTSASWRRT